LSNGVRIVVNIGFVQVRDRVFHQKPKGGVEAFHCRNGVWFDSEVPHLVINAIYPILNQGRPFIGDDGKAF